MQLRNGWTGWRISCAALATAVVLGSTAGSVRAGDRPVVVRPAIRITVSPGSTPTAKFVQYGYASGGWGWGPSYRGWGGYGWGGYGGWVRTVEHPTMPAGGVATFQFMEATTAVISITAIRCTATPIIILAMGIIRSTATQATIAIRATGTPLTGALRAAAVMVEATDTAATVTVADTAEATASVTGSGNDSRKLSALLKCNRRGRACSRERRSSVQQLSAERWP